MREFNVTGTCIPTMHYMVDIKNNKYVKLITLLGANEIDDQLKDISDDKGLIFEAYRVGCSLIKSFNITLHEDGNNDSTWLEYITIPIVNTFKDNIKYLSIGISVKYPNKHRNMLDFIRIE